MRWLASGRECGYPCVQGVEMWQIYYLSSTLADVMLCFELGIGAPMAPMKIASVFKIETENKQVPQ